jgi:hypothetical protein
MKLMENTVVIYPKVKNTMNFGKKNIVDVNME